MRIHLSLAIIALLLVAQTLSQVIDDFEYPLTNETNTLGFWRYAANAETWPGTAMLIMTRDTGHLIEGLSVVGKVIDLTGKAIKITYSTFTKTMIKIMLIELRHPQAPRNSGIEVNFYPDLDHVIVPISAFTRSNPKQATALHFTGPIVEQLSLLRLELVPVPSALVDLPFTRNNALLIDEFADSVTAMNNFGLQAQYNVYTLSQYGLLLPTAQNYVREKLAPMHSCFDMSGKSFLVHYSVSTPNPINVTVQSKRRACNGFDLVERNALIMLKQSVNENLRIPVSIFKGINPALISSIKIQGPMYIHRIEIVTDMENAPKPVLVSAFQYKIFEIRNAVKTLDCLSPTLITVDRNDLYESAFSQVMTAHPALLQCEIMVKFQNETGVDLGGLSREFMTLLSSEISTTSHRLFDVSAETNYALQINPNCNELGDYRFVGRTMGLAILHDLMLNVRFVPTLYKLIQGVYPTLADMKLVDPTTHQSLQKILREKNAHELGLTMSVEYRTSSNQLAAHNLKPNGEHVPVTDANKVEYVNLYCKWRIGTQFQKQVNAIRTGMHAIVPREHLSRLKPAEIGILISGAVKIDIDEWKLYTTYDGYTETHPTIQHFWTCVSQWTQHQRSKVLNFVTGSPRIPPKEFRNVYGPLFFIKQSGDLDNLPSAHTCTKLLVLPAYADFDTLCDKLKLAVHESGTFEMV